MKLIIFCIILTPVCIALTFYADVFSICHWEFHSYVFENMAKCFHALLTMLTSHFHTLYSNTTGLYWKWDNWWKKDHKVGVDRQNGRLLFSPCMEAGLWRAHCNLLCLLLPLLYHLLVRSANIYLRNDPH